MRPTPEHPAGAIARRRLAGAVAGLACGRAALAAERTITGAGASFPAPAYLKWAAAAAAAIGIGVNYQAIGSGGGINQLANRTVDFAASDVPLVAARLDRMRLMQFPTLIGGIVPAINVAGLADGQLRLSGTLLADIYLGRIARWNDRRLAAANPDAALPDIPIAPVYRADAAGATFGFTDYLARISDDWRAGVGRGVSVRWPLGMGARGNDGIAAVIQNTRGGIGYLEYAFARLNRLAMVQLQNRDGRFIQPGEPTFLAAAEGADWRGDGSFAISLNDAPGQGAWPITAATFILLPTDPPAPQRTQDCLRFFDWAFRHGGELAEALGYVALPPDVQTVIRAAWQDRLGFRGD